MRIASMDCETCTNENCFIKHCSQEWISKISKVKSSFRCSKKQNFILEGSPVMGIYFIYQGAIKVTMKGMNNKEQIVRLANDGHIVGHRGYGSEYYPIGAAALEDARICFIGNEVLYEAFSHNPKFTIATMMFYSQELRKSEMRVKYFAQMTTGEKVAYALYYIYDAFGLKEKVPEITLSRQEIASIAGTAADQVSRIITELKKKKVLDTYKRKIILNNPAELQKIVENYFPFSL